MALQGWETGAAVLAVVTPLVVVPLTVIMFHLKGLREQQSGRVAELTRRVESAEAALRRTSGELANVHRDYATMEEWLRESMWARHRVERIQEWQARMEARITLPGVRQTIKQRSMKLGKRRRIGAGKRRAAVVPVQRRAC